MRRTAGLLFLLLALLHLSTAVARASEALRPEVLETFFRLRGRPILHCSDGTSYVVVSLGADGALVGYGVDGQPDCPYATWGQVEFEALATGPTTRLGQDLVFVNGQFAQWPAVGVGP